MNKNIQDRIIFLEKVISKMPGLVYCKDIDGVYLGCNESQAKIIGFSTPNEIIGKTDFDLLKKKEATKLRNIDKQVISGELIIDEAHPIEEQILLPNGETAIFESVKSPLYDDNGKIIGLIGISKDITARKKAEMAKNDFISNMEHDLRTPFSGIGGIANLLHSLYKDKYPEIKNWLEIMVKSCGKWEAIHNRIFDALATHQQLKIETFFIQDELEKIKDLLLATIHIKKLKFYINSPSREETGPIATDNLKLHLILISLIGNAVNFTEMGSVTVNVTRNKNSFVISIIDTGIGIPTNQLEYIFEKFTKLSRSNKYGEEFKGMGLGLYISKIDATALHGKITVKSELGKGSIFTLTLPVKY